ncbi:MAG: type II toxin-antitoxin system VapC family toxin [Nitriliruptor sp.]|uniref:type II toxin-antitoxin system VapC family toxin n=1 Tax=Nitriliruptor sp. TaxID=2448056 RepID=UPI0034A0AAA4
MILLDTTVLIYAVGGDHPLRGPAAALVDAVGSGELRGTTTVEVIQEFTRVRARRRGREDAASLASELVTLLSPLTTVTSSDLVAGLRRFRGAESLGCFGAVLAAAAHRTGAVLVTADRVLLAELDDAVALDDAPRILLGR